MKLKLLILWMLFLLYIPSRAQYWLGISNSNYGGTNTLYMNPSAIANGREKLYINLVGAGTHFNNDYLVYDSPYSILKVLRERQKTNKDPNYTPTAEFKREYLKETVNGKSKNLYMQGEVRGPSVAFSINENNSFALSTRTRFSAQLLNVSEPMARIIRSGLDTSGAGYTGENPISFDKLYSNNSFNVNALAFQEIALTYARTIVDRDRHYVKGGITGKYFVPLFTGFARNNGVGIAVYGQDSLGLTNTGVSYGYSNENYYSDGFKPSKLIGKDALGRGYGFDLGFTYEYRPDIDKYKYRMDGKDQTDRSRNKYKFRFSASLMDVGSVKFDNSSQVKNHLLADSAYIVWGSIDTVKLGEYADISSMEALDSAFAEVIGFQSTTHSIRSRLPATLNINFDYNIWKRFYVNVTWIQSLRSKEVSGVRNVSMLTVMPRYERKWIEVAVPISLTEDYRRMRFGAMLRTGPLFIGSDNLGGLFGLSTIKGFDMYFGLSIPLYHKKQKDKDKDGVSDRRDLCKTVPGVWEFKGCPDTDMDGVEDKLDKCPTVPGKKELAGCPDRDNDGITDAQDACPDDAGPLELNGCPDRDGDKVIDKDDECPDLPGPAEQNGCPDRDHDGVMDTDDECPDEAGVPALRGCPDADGDGVMDKADKCPNTPGLPELEGCPDTDGDGVADLQDKCPTVAGPARFQGCPDTDDDGIPDYADLCPLEKGLPENNGCPKVAQTIELLEIPEEDQQVLNEVFSNLEFETGKSTIRTGSFASLNELVELLNKRPVYRLYVAGHTDNVGNKTTNLKLSKDRAAAVKKFLTERGIDPTRIQPEGFGMERPVASNKTPEGRQKNRRVEFRVIK